MRIKLRFSTTKSPFSWLIRRHENSEFSHVSIVLPDGRLLSAVVGFGVCILPGKTYKKYKDFEVLASEDVLRYALSQLGKGYDYKALFGLFLKRKWNNEDAWTCAELIAWSFMQAGYPLLNTCDCFSVSQRDILLSPKLKEI